MAQPPQFENKPNCYNCNAGFGVFYRKHHCRNCGKTCCQNCSSKNIPIPDYGFVEPTRVCDGCYNLITSQLNSKKSDASKTKTGSNNTKAPTSQSPSSSSQSRSQNDSSNISDAKASKDDMTERKTKKNCVCNNPLCICPDVVEQKSSSSSSLSHSSQPSSSSSSAAAAPNKTSVQGSQSQSQSQSQSPNVFMGFGSSAQHSYDLKGDLNEQCRDAVKSGDVTGVTNLLKAGANAAYKDRTGSTLVHLAAMFNRLELVLLLVKHGADINAQNPQGETAIDVAPPALQHKMRQPNFGKE